MRDALFINGNMKQSTQMHFFHYSIPIMYIFFAKNFNEYTQRHNINDFGWICFHFSFIFQFSSFVGTITPAAAFTTSTSKRILYCLRRFIYIFVSFFSYLIYKCICDHTIPQQIRRPMKPNKNWKNFHFYIVKLP